MRKRHGLKASQKCLLHNVITQLQNKNGQCCMTILDNVAKPHI